MILSKATCIAFKVYVLLVYTFSGIQTHDLLCCCHHALLFEILIFYLVNDLLKQTICKIFPLGIYVHVYFD